jgi:hypothetical protein
LQDILKAQNAVKVLNDSRDLLIMALGVYQRVVQFAMENFKDVEYATYTFLLESVSQLLQGDSTAQVPYIFSSSDVSMFLELADCLTRFSSSDDITPIKKNIRETSLQRATLQLIDRLPFVNGPMELSEKVISQVAKYVRGAIPTDQRIWNRSSLPSDIAENGQAASSAVYLVFAQKAVPVLVTLYCQKCSSEIRGSPKLLDVVFSALFDVINCRSIMKSSDLCVESFRALLQAIPTGLESFNAHVGANESEIVSIWDSLLQSFKHFIFSSLDSDLAARDSKKHQSMKLDLIGFIGSDILPRAQSVGLEHRKKFISLLNEICGMSRSGNCSMENLELIQSAIDSMAAICHYDPSNWSDYRQANAVECIPVLISVSDRILRGLLEEERHIGDRPVSYVRCEESCHVLRRLYELEVPPGVYVRGGGSGHLLSLWEVLCECVLVRESGLKQVLSGVFRRVGRSIGL